MKLIAFDLFGTVFDLSQTPREEVVAYIDHISRPGWSPLTLPKSWEQLPAFADSREGIERLRKKYTVVTCSNAPLGFTAQLLKNADIRFDAITPLEMAMCFKPRKSAYLLLPTVYGVDPHEVLMVTGNERLGRNPKGDREYATEAGLGGGLLIRNPGGAQTITQLADVLGC